MTRGNHTLKQYGRTIGLAVGLMVAHAANADEFRVTIPDVWGAQEIEKGQIAAGIARMERQPAALPGDERGALLVALCGAYTIAGNLEKASDACDAAVRQPYLRTMAFNNRGVLRANQGDFGGARQDFRDAQSGPIERSYQDSQLKRATRQIVKQNAEYSERLWAAVLHDADSTVAGTN